MKTSLSTHRLAGYLAATATLGTLASSTEAAIVSLDVSSISGPNGGLTQGPDGFTFVDLQTLSPSAPAGAMALANTFNPENSLRLMGFVGYPTEFALDDIIKPTNFSASADISAAAFPDLPPVASLFFLSGTDVTLSSPDFGPDSYMGFRVPEEMLPNPLADPDNPDYDPAAPTQIPNGNYYYGWLEVTWNTADEEFQILSGAVNTTLNAPITAGTGGVSAIPEPSSSVGTLGILAAGMMIRRRGKKAA